MCARVQFREWSDSRQRGAGVLEVVQEVGVESPELFDLDSAHAEVVQDPGKDAGVCSGLSSSSSFKVPSWNEVSQHTHSAGRRVHAYLTL